MQETILTCLELYHVKISVLEKVWTLGEVYLKEDNHIRDFNTEPDEYEQKTHP